MTKRPFFPPLSVEKRNYQSDRTNDRKTERTKKQNELDTRECLSRECLPWVMMAMTWRNTKQMTFGCCRVRSRECPEIWTEKRYWHVVVCVSKRYSIGFTMRCRGMYIYGHVMDMWWRDDDVSSQRERESDRIVIWKLMRDWYLSCFVSVYQKPSWYCSVSKDPRFLF